MFGNDPVSDLQGFAQGRPGLLAAGQKILIGSIGPAKVVSGINVVLIEREGGEEMFTCPFIVGGIEAAEQVVRLNSQFLRLSVIGRANASVGSTLDDIDM